MIDNVKFPLGGQIMGRAEQFLFQGIIIRVVKILSSSLFKKAGSTEVSKGSKLVKTHWFSS
jgi:hypothetical protein